MLKPMLAATIEDLKVLRFPLYVSYKLDGIRATVQGGQLLSRSLKPIRNKFTQELFKGLPEGFDGELCVGPINDKNLMQKTSSGVMSIEGEPDVTFHVFDYQLQAKSPFTRRYGHLERVVWDSKFPSVALLLQEIVNSVEELEAYEREALLHGFEGVIARSGSAPYKNGRSTMREQYLMKLKQWVDEEATIIGFKEQMHNANEAFKDERGYTKRSGHKENMVGKDTLGSLIARTKSGREVDVGSGFDDALRREVWDNRDKYLGRLFTFKHFAVTGVKEKPRQPIFKWFRDKDDIS
jgi:DNA ligase-1